MTEINRIKEVIYGSEKFRETVQAIYDLPGDTRTMAQHVPGAVAKIAVICAMVKDEEMPIRIKIALEDTAKEIRVFAALLEETAKSIHFAKQEVESRGGGDRG